MAKIASQPPVEQETRHLIVEGSVTVTEGGKATTAGVGDLLIVPKGTKLNWEFQQPFKNHATAVGAGPLDDDFKGNKDVFVTSGCGPTIDGAWYPEVYTAPFQKPTAENSRATWEMKFS